MEEKNNNNQVVIRKISLKVFIDALVTVYNSGADFVDLVGNADDKQDSIGIVVHEDYLTDDIEELEITDEEEPFEEQEYPNTTLLLPPKESKPLSDDDINELI